MPESKNVDLKHSEREIAVFVKEYKQTIYGACDACGLGEADRDGMAYAAALKYACGKMESDLSKKADMNTFVCKVSRNEAINAWKKYRSCRFIAAAAAAYKKTGMPVKGHPPREENGKRVTTCCGTWEAPC